MKIRAGFAITFECPQPTPMILMLNVHPSRKHDLLTPQVLSYSRDAAARDYLDGYGNVCTRIVAPPGALTIGADFLVRDSGDPDIIMPEAVEHAVADLPDSVLVYLLASRYCDTERLTGLAWSLFGATQPGWPRVQAICDYVHERIRFDYQSASPIRTAWDGHEQRVGVCRDFAHLAIAFCRAMNIPARYCTGYLGDIGIPPVPYPMDFSAWFEVYLGGRWHVFDARHNTPRIGRILIARGRDATDVAISTAFGPNVLSGFSVVTDEVVEEPAAAALSA